MAPLKVLIVDDHELVRRGIRSLLSLAPHTAVCGEAGDGLGALMKARTLRPDIVIMDVSMPRMDGIEATKILRQELPETDVIVISQNDPMLVAPQVAKTGARAYITKSKLGVQLLPTIEGIVSDRQSNKAQASHSAQEQSSESSQSVNERIFREMLDALPTAIVDSSDDAIVSKNLSGRITSWNKSAERIFGYSSSEAVGQNITMIIPPERRDEELEILARLARGERIEHFDTVRRRKDGTPIDVSLTVSPIRNAAGQIVGASKVARDITERIRAEKAVRESEERFRAIVETTPECVKLVALDGTLEQMNSSGLQMIGADSLEAVVGRSVYDLVAPEDRGRFRVFHEEVCSGQRGTLAFDIVGLDGTRRHMETHATPMRTPEGQIVQLAVTRDVSERQLAEERERRITTEAVANNAKFRAVFEQTSVFAGIMTNDGIVIDANRMCLDVCGYRAEDVLGKPLWETGWWRGSAKSRERIRTATALVAQGVPYREVLEYSWADGTVHLVDFALYPIMDDQNRVIFLHPTGVDITDLKRAEENYRKLVESLDAEVRDRTSELESRNVEVIRQTELLREFSQRLLQTQDAERRHIARELHDSAGQTLAVLNMDIALLVQKAGRHAPELVAAAEKIEKTARQLQREIRTTSYLLHPPLLDEAGLSSALGWYIQGLAERSALEIDLNIAPDFGRLPRDLELVIFRLVQESLTNIHRHSGSKTAAIRLSRHAREIRLEIRDQGQGISAERLADIQSGASGVGTRGMRERVRQFEGQIRFESNSSGTKVVVTFPIPISGPCQTGTESSVASIRATV
ncbi:MAG: PAS domain S-box protein [Candidatus Acidiferrales bacterium]